MKIKASNKEFDPCPEYTGKAVCVDVTPLRKQQSQYGEWNVFRIVFKVDTEKEDGGPYSVWSTNFTPTLNEKASLRKFCCCQSAYELSAPETPPGAIFPSACCCRSRSWGGAVL